MQAKKRLKLIDLMQELRHGYGESPSYSQLWAAAIQGKIPAEREGRSMTVDPTDVPAVARYFGLAEPVAA